MPRSATALHFMSTYTATYLVSAYKRDLSYSFTRSFDITDPIVSRAQCRRTTGRQLHRPDGDGFRCIA